MEKTITLGASNYAGTYLLPHILPDWERNHPEIEVKVKTTDSQKTFEKVIKGEIDAGIIGASMEDEKIETSEFAVRYDELVLIVPINHPLALKNEVSINELRNQDFITREPGSATRMWYREAFTTHNLTFDQLKIVAELDSHQAIINAVESGTGISMVPRRIAQEAIKLNKVKEMRIKELSPMMGNSYIIWNKEKPLSKDMQEFMNFLAKEKNKLIKES